MKINNSQEIKNSNITLMASMLFWRFKLANSRKIAQKVAPYVNYNLKIINIKIKKRVEKKN